MIARSDNYTAGGYVFNAIRPEFLAVAPSIGVTFAKYAFPDDLPAGAWLDAPEWLPGGGCIKGTDGTGVYQSAAWRA